MTKVYLSLGSNINRYTHITAALEELTKEFGDLLISSVYESESVGFDGDPFLNLVVEMETELPIGELNPLLRHIETENGRVRGGPKFSSRTLDIDILTYGDFVGEESGVQLPRDEILKNAFVLRPLAEIAGDQCHPEMGVSYTELWAAYDKAKQKLWPVSFKWHQRELSKLL